jgi:hypothetical protein
MNIRKRKIDNERVSRHQWIWVQLSWLFTHLIHREFSCEHFLLFCHRQHEKCLPPFSVISFLRERSQVKSSESSSSSSFLLLCRNSSPVYVATHTLSLSFFFGVIIRLWQQRYSFRMTEVVRIIRWRVDANYFLVSNQFGKDELWHKDAWQRNSTLVRETTFLATFFFPFSLRKMRKANRHLDLNGRWDCFVLMTRYLKI